MEERESVVVTTEWLLAKIAELPKGIFETYATTFPTDNRIRLKGAFRCPICVAMDPNGETPYGIAAAASVCKYLDREKLTPVELVAITSVAAAADVAEHPLRSKLLEAIA